MQQLQTTYYRHITPAQGIALLVIGLAGAYIIPVISLLWLVVILLAVYGLFINDMRWLWYGVAASPALEVLARMSRAPFIPHEIGKYYLVLVIFLLFIQHSIRSSQRPLYHMGLLILACLAPSVVVGLSAFHFEDWVLNLFGIIQLGCLLIFMARERWSVEEFCRVLQFGLMPVILMLLYLTVNTPDFEKLNFTLSSNFKTSGDFGGDQVSTILGLGMVLTVLLIILKRPLFKLMWLNYLLLCFLLFRGFLTFSRGGMVTAILAIIIALLPAALANTRSFVRFTMFIVAFVGISAFVFFQVNDLTGNQLLLRYQGETAGTMAGTKQRTLNTITSSRLVIAQTDWGIFKDNIVFGAGPGMSKGLRPQYGFEAIASHTEYTRLLSEHGIGGILVTLFLFSFPFWWIRRQKLSTWKAVSGALFVFALLTCVHSAMRTNSMVVYYILAAVPVYFVKPKATTFGE